MKKFLEKKRSSGSVKHAPGENPKVTMNPEYEAVSKWLKSVRFRPKLVGGVDPEDVWKKLEELNALYENALISERARYNMMLRQIMMDRNAEEKNG